MRGRNFLKQTGLVLAGLSLEGCSDRGIDLPSELERLANEIKRPGINNKKKAEIADQIGTLYFVVSEKELAEHWYDASIKLNPTAKTYANLAEVFLIDGGLEKSYSLLQEGLKIGNNAKLHDRLGEVYLRSSLFNMRGSKLFEDRSDLHKKALEESKKAVSLDPKSVDSLVQLGAAYILNEDYDGAIKTLKKAGSRVDARYNLALANYKAGNKRTARSIWNNVAKQGSPIYSRYAGDGVDLTKGDARLGGGFGGPGGLVYWIGPDGGDLKPAFQLTYSRTLEPKVKYTGVSQQFSERFVNLVVNVKM